MQTDIFLSEMNFRPYILSLLVTLACGKDQEVHYQRLPNAIAVVGRSFKYFLPHQVESHHLYKVSAQGKPGLPRWLSFDSAKNQLHGVAQWRDKGKVDIEIHSVKRNDKAVFTIFIQDLHTLLNNQSLFSNETKVPDFTEPKCVNGLPVAVATVLFDLNMETFSGSGRENLMSKLSDFVNVNINNIHMAVGRGHNTAFGLKDATVVTAGPGNVADSKQPGIAISWQIGCGVDVSGIQVASLLKSSSERGSFQHALDAPVTGWHIVTGHPKSHRQRVRRQINLSPTPIATQMLGSVVHHVIYVTATQTYTMSPPPPTLGSVTVTVSAVVTPTVHPVNHAPEVRKPLGPLTVYLGKALRYTIPADTIWDQEDGSTRNLRLEMRTGNGEELSASSWIKFNSSKQEIYGMPLEEGSRSHSFLLIATDSGGKSLRFSFTVQVSEVQSVTFNHKFTIVMHYNKLLMNDVGIQLNLMRKISRYYGTKLNHLHLLSYKYYHGALFFTFQLESPGANADCNNQFLRGIKDGIGNNEKLNQNFVAALLPEFKIMYGYFEGIGSCKAPKPPFNYPPRVRSPVGPLYVVWGQAMHYSIPFNTFYDEQDYYTPNMRIQMRTGNNEALPSTSWIQFNSSQQVIYGETNDQTLVGQHMYRIVAMDSEGLETFVSFNVTVQHDTGKYNHEFGIQLRRSFYQVLVENATVRVSLIKAIASYYGLALKRVRFARYVPGASVHFRFDSIPYEDCNSLELTRLIDGFWMHQQKEVNDTFVAHLKHHKFTVRAASYRGLGPCTKLTPEVKDGKLTAKRRHRLEVFLGQVLKFHVPFETFYDWLDFYTPNLKLYIRPQKSGLPGWIVVDPLQNVLALPLNKRYVGKNEFDLVAKNSREKEGETELTVTVLTDANPYNHEFTIRFKHFALFKNNVTMGVTLVERIAAYYGLHYKNIRVPTEGPEDAFTFRFDTVPFRECNHRNLTKLVDGFWSGKALNPKFEDALEPDFQIISGYYKLREPCALNTTPPLVMKPIGTLTITQGQQMKYHIPLDTFHDKEDGYTTNLTLMASMDNKDLPSWIFLNSSNQDLIILPIDSSAVGTHNLHLTAVDRGGFAATDIIEVKVLSDFTIYKNEFQFDIVDASVVVENVQTKMLLMHKLAAYFGVPLEDVHISGFGRDYPPTCTFHLKSLKDLKCDDSGISDVIKSFIKEDGKLNKNFVNTMEPEFEVSAGLHKGLGPCKPPPPAPNTPPKLYNHIDRLDVFQGQGLRFHIPYDSFFDKEDGYTPDLSLKMNTIDGHELLNTSWILLNSSRQEILGLPADVNRIGMHEVLLIASDKEGARAYDAFEVRVLEEDTPYNHKFNIVLDYDNATFLGKVGIRVMLLDTIASYFGVNFTSVRVVSYAPGVLFSFYFDFIPYDDCSHSLLRKLIDDFELDGGLNPAFVAALRPGFRVSAGSYERVGPCQPVSGPEIGAKVGDRPGGIWWTYAIIPAIVLAIVLLVIGCCLLIMMGCCRRNKMSGAEKMTYIYKKKPVVLQEEYEIKEMLLKQPLALPNEKPPVPPVYPRSPVMGGDRTPLLNTESKSVSYRAPVYTSNGQMAGSVSGNAGFVPNGGGGAAGGGELGAAGGGGAAAGGGAAGASLAGGGAAVGVAAGGSGGSSSFGGGGGGGGGSAGAGGGFGASGGGGMSAGGGGGAGSGMESAGAGAGAGSGTGQGGGSGLSVSYSMATGGGRFKQSSYSYSYSSSGGSVSSSGRKMAYSGYRLPPAYVPP